MSIKLLKTCPTLPRTISWYGTAVARSKNGRRGTIPFARLDHPVIRSPEWSSLSGNAVKLFIDLQAQYNGHNNGDLDIRWNRLKKGWRSKATLYRAMGVLLDRGWVIQTRQGGKNYPSLYAITTQPYDECRGKNLSTGPTNKPTHKWKGN